MNQPSAFSRQLSANTLAHAAATDSPYFTHSVFRSSSAIGMHHIVASQPGLERKHRQNRQSGERISRIAQRCPRQHRPEPQRRPAPCRDDSFKSLVHREGFEPSYLRGGADLQSAGFNHSPTCAELQNSPALLLHPAFIADFHASVRRSFRRILQKYGFANVKNRNARENAIARKHHTWKIPLWSAVGKSVKPPRRACVSCVRNQCWSWRRDLNP